MMVVTPALMDAFEARTMQAFRREMTRHCQREFPTECSGLTQAQLHAAVASSIDSAARNRFTLRGSMRLYLELTFMLGCGFDTDPQYLWAQGPLKLGESEEDRAEELFQQASHYACCIDGDQNAQLVMALEEHLLNGEGSFTGDAPAEPRQLLKLLHCAAVAKARHAGDVALHELIEQVIERARVRYQIAAATEVSAFLLATFFLGHRCDDDPLYPWLKPLLQTANARGGLASRLATHTRQWFHPLSDDMPELTASEAARWPQ